MGAGWVSLSDELEVSSPVSGSKDLLKRALNNTHHALSRDDNT